MSEVPADAYEAYAGDDPLDEARAVAGAEPPAEPVTTYRVHIGVFLSTPSTTDADEAQTWSDAGLTVTAVTEGQR